MKTKKAVVTVAGKKQRNLPLQTLVDCDGIEKSVLEIIIEQSLAAGIEEIGLVINPEDKEKYKEVAKDYISRINFIPQPDPLGYGHAVYCAKGFSENSPVLHLVGDHLNVSSQPEGCSEKLVKISEAEDCTVSAVQSTSETQLPFYGTVGGKRVPGKKDLYKVERVIEKPTPTEAEQSLIIPGLRSSHYLCFFGIHVLTPAVFDILGFLLNKNKESKNITLSSALDELSKKEQYLAFEYPGMRYDLGSKYGLFTAQIALALNGTDRDVVLTKMLELLGQKELSFYSNKPE
ncbi:MAG TPA: sugar phosphate nucleotidyltransferase [Ignavibacteriaceae bacterium]|nr:sugar phosphate nucleotidyltransferase [Ignavibacteriaceae bacterium]